MYRRILLATDGSPGADVAAEHAIDLAVRVEAALVVLTVVDADAIALDRHARHVTARLEAEARRAVADVVDRATDAGVEPVRAEVARGTPHAVIVEVVVETGADLVVVGRRGHGEAERALLGSVADRVVRTADVPVLVVGG